ncbi:MAG: pyridoxal phosphate-dependent aminotransferase [Pyrinomonadaceae bacterium]|nr:pyridoxal phosphate-dependent aminotransferase [Phycisphaerales bacterium]
MNIESLLTDRTKLIDASGIRRVFEYGAKLKDKIDFSIGQPNFPVHDSVKQAAMSAIAADQNGYTITQGIQPLREKLCSHLNQDLGWNVDPKAPNGDPNVPALLVSPGTSASLVLAFMALIGPGDEAIIPDPYFVLYPHLANLVGGKAICCDTYPDFRMTAERVEPLITPRTKLVILNSPGNPSGVVMNQRECEDLLDLCRRKNIVLISDEIYDEFTFSNARERIRETSQIPAVERASRPLSSEPHAQSSGSENATTRLTARIGADKPICPSPARVKDSFYNTLVVRGFGKTYGVTGWRLGYAIGPARLIAEMTKLQQYTYVCAPHPLQVGAIAALDVDVSANIAAYEANRDIVMARLGLLTELNMSGGAFYAFPRIPARLGLSGEAFFQKCVDRKLLIVPGNVFSRKDTHFRLSFAVSPETLAKGLDVLADIMA